MKNLIKTNTSLSDLQREIDELELKLEQLPTHYPDQPSYRRIDEEEEFST